MTTTIKEIIRDAADLLLNLNSTSERRQKMLDRIYNNLIDDESIITRREFETQIDNAVNHQYSDLSKYDKVIKYR
jgi:hypothetical protein